ncbi:hypothetical protein B0H11DRAFT_2236759 [Mycena galericulata]|nr:hypothetical protein B0H11DRAFT_2236759 [Mycena galericulata]
MSGFAQKPALRTIDLSKVSMPTEAQVVVVPLPKKTIGITFGQRTAAWLQRSNTYLLDTDHLVLDPQAVWDAPEDNSRFKITTIIPASALDLDPAVLSVGPYNEDRYIAVYVSHMAPNDTDYVSSTPKFDYHEFKIDGKDAIKFTMVNAEDGGDQDYHDTVVGIAVLSTTK